MAKFSPMDVHIPTDGQTVIKLNHPYVMGSGELMVYLNGMVAVLGEDYDETDNTTITFRFQLSSQDVVITQHLVYYDDKAVKVITDDKQSLFHRYGLEDRLKKNQKYTVTFNYGPQEMSFSFYTRMEPLYSTVETIRGDLGVFISTITDFQIMYLIHENSKIAEQEFATELEDNNGEPTFAMRQWVRYRTELDLVLQLYMHQMGRSGSDHMILGQLEIERRSNLGDYEPLMKELKAKLMKYQRRGSPVRTAVKGGSTYPLNAPRRDFNVTIGGTTQ